MIGCLERSERLPWGGSGFHTDLLFAESDALHALCGDEDPQGRIRCALDPVSGEQGPQARDQML